MESENDDSGGRPSLEHLAERVRRRRNQSDSPSSPDTVDHESHESPPADASEFVFPADTETDRFDDFGTDAKTDALVALIGDVSNLLLLGPMSCPADYDLCTRLMTGTDADLANLLMVTYNESPDTRVNVLRGHLDDLPDTITILSVGASAQAASVDLSQTNSPETITVESIPDPTDLQRLGIAISQHLGDWEPIERDTLVCFHTLSALLRVVDDPQRAFRFLNTLLARVQSVNAVAHYHLDPTLHEQELIATFRPLFGEILTFDEDGDLQVDRQS